MTSDFAEFDAYEPAPDDSARDVSADEFAEDAAPDFAEDSAPDFAENAAPGDPGHDGASAPVTGNPRVDAATALLDDIDKVPSVDAAEVFDEVHRRLQGALADLDGD